MTSWLALGVLMLVSFSKASIFSIELEDQIKEGIKKVNTSEEFVKKEVEDVNREINKVSLYFSRAVNESTVEGKKIYDISTQKVGKTIIEKFEEGIDKGKDVRVLLYLLETMETTENELDGRYDIFTSCLKNVLVQKSNELQKPKNVFEYTEKFSTGFYNGLRSKMKNCKDPECIKPLVQAAEKKEKILTNMFKKYVKEMANIKAGLQEGHRHCMHGAQKNFSEVLKKFENDILFWNADISSTAQFGHFENDMEYNPTAQGTGDLTDRFDSVILEL